MSPVSGLMQSQMESEANQMDVRWMSDVKSEGSGQTEIWKVRWKSDAEQMEVRRIRWKSDVKSEGSGPTDIRTVRWRSDARQMAIRWIRWMADENQMEIRAPTLPSAGSGLGLCRRLLGLRLTTAAGSWPSGGE